MLSSERQLEVILEHALALADEVRGHLDVPVPGCPAWDVAGLLEHLIEVHWFWAYDVENKLQAHFEGERPPPPVRDALIDTFVSGARHLVDVLGAVDPTESVWTWAPTNQTAGFVARHQVQEMVVHHVDGARAVGRDVVITPDVGADCVDEFLTYSLSSGDDPKDPAPPPLGFALALRTSDGDATWTVRDGPVPGTLTVARRPEADAITVTAGAGELLLWLYGRIELDAPNLSAEGRARFRALTYTD